MCRVRLANLSFRVFRHIPTHFKPNSLGNVEDGAGALKDLQITVSNFGEFFLEKKTTGFRQQICFQWSYKEAYPQLHFDPIDFATHQIDNVLAVLH